MKLQGKAHSVVGALHTSGYNEGGSELTARGGSVGWQMFDSSGRATTIKGAAPGMPVWSFAAPIAVGDGRFVIVY